MSDSDLVEITKRNGDFRKNYGPILGAMLFAWTTYLSARPRSIFRPGWLIALGTAFFGAWKLWVP